MLDVSLAICTRNRAARLRCALESLTRLRRTRCRMREVIVVNNNCTDATPDVIAEFGDRLPIREIVERRRGLGAARNSAIRFAAGDVLAFTDDDCYPQSDWLDVVADAFESPEKPGMVAGQVFNYRPNYAPFEVRHASREVIRGADAFETPSVKIIGANMAFARQVFERVGGFDERFGAGAPFRAGEDLDFLLRVVRAGFTLVFEPNAVVMHDHDRVSERQALRIDRNYNWAVGCLLAKRMSEGRWDPRPIYWGIRDYVTRGDGATRAMLRSMCFLSGLVQYAMVRKPRDAGDWRPTI